jgi:uncharacterized C2H2 Zn-finger protein
MLRDCPRRIHEKEIVCLRDLEKILVLNAPVSDIHTNDVVGGVAHWLSRCLKEKAKTATMYLDFLSTSIDCIQATVDFIHERERTLPSDRPYTNGYFVDLRANIRNYAQQVLDNKEKIQKGESLGELDAESYDTPVNPIPCTSIVQPQHMTHVQTFNHQSPTSHTYKFPNTNFFSFRTDEVKLYGGLSRNGRPVELVRVKKNGKAVSITTGEEIKLESIEEDEKGGFRMKRSLSEEAENEEAILRSMARRKRSASAAELAPKRCSVPNCTKEFKRSCDLTKHEKTHSRPWKCEEKSCKYHEYGWPTEKELDRHVNDKHTVNPHTYHCQYQPCPYKSKRESNCKQHMEKSHGWNYVRSKHNGKNRSKAGDSTLPTPQTFNHRTPDTDSFDEPTPEDNYDQPMETFNANIGFDRTVYGDHSEYLDYPDHLMIDAQPFISPVESYGQNNSLLSSENTSPFLANNEFQLTHNQTNFVQQFGSGGDFPLFGDEDIYNARVQLPTPPHAVFQPGCDLDAIMASVPMKEEPVPHISPHGHGNTMLYTPTSLMAVDESFEHCDPTEHYHGHDYQLFSNTKTLGSTVHQENPLFGEVLPSAGTGFSQPNLHSQQYFQAFYNHNSGPGWLQDDEGFSGGFGDQLVQ